MTIKIYCYNNKPIMLKHDTGLFLFLLCGSKYTSAVERLERRHTNTVHLP